MIQDDDIIEKDGGTSEQSIMKPKILIVDDEPFNVELLEGYLSKEYYDALMGDCHFLL